MEWDQRRINLSKAKLACPGPRLQRRGHALGTGKVDISDYNSISSALFCLPGGEGYQVGDFTARVSSLWKERKVEELKIFSSN